MAVKKNEVKQALLLAGFMGAGAVVLVWAIATGQVFAPWG